MGLARVIALVVLLGGAAACGGTPASSDRGDYAVHVLTEAARLDAGAYAFVPRRLTEALPTVRYDDGDVRIPASRLAVTGTFTTAPSRARTVHLTVDQLVSGARTSARTLIIGMPTSGETDDDHFRRSLAELGDCLLFLNRGAPGEWSLDFYLLATVRGGRITLRVNGFDMTKDAKTLDDLRSAASSPEVIRIR